MGAISVESFRSRQGETISPFSFQFQAFELALVRSPQLCRAIQDWVTQNQIVGPIEFVWDSLSPHVLSPDGNKKLFLPLNDCAPLLAVSHAIENLAFQKKGSWGQNAIKRAQVAANLTSFAQNQSKWVISEGEHHPFMKQLGFGIAPIGAGVGLYQLWSGFNEREKGARLGDQEGVMRANGKIATSGIAAYGGSFYLGSTIANQCSGSSAATAATILQQGASYCWGVGSLVAIALNGVEFFRCHQFRRDLSEMLNHPNQTREQQCRKALEFLRDLTTATPRERVECQNQPEKIAALIATKQRALRRRTSARAVWAILQNVDSLLLRSSSGDLGWLDEAEKLVELVESSNRMKHCRYFLGFLAGLISVIAFLIGTFFSFGTLPLILMVVSSLLAGLGVAVPWVGNLSLSHYS